MTVRSHDAPAPGSDEQYVREVLDAAMSGARPPLDLPSAALSRGRRLRTRRRLAVAGTVAAVGVLAAVAAPLLAPGSVQTRPGGDGDGLVATQPPAPLPTQAAGWWDMPATDMVTAVEAIAPDGVLVTDPGPLEADTPEGGPASGSINPEVSGPRGPGRVNVVLWPDWGGGSQESGAAANGATAEPTPAEPYVGPDGWLDCPGNLIDPQQCTVLHDAEGRTVGRRSVSRSGDLVVLEVTLRRDGGTVYAASVNSLDDKPGAGSAVSAPRPPMTLDELEDLVRNDVWVSYRP